MTWRMFFETLVDSDVMRKDQKAIWTTWKVSMEALDDISRRAICAVAMLGGGRSAEESYEASCERMRD